jgi:hypothetical protein
MKKNTLLFFFLWLFLYGYPQQTAFTLLEYRPAPGQHINLDNTGTPAAAQKMTESFNSLVSLGSFGGYITLRFDRACVNHPDHPYGIDFTVFGNAFSGSSEPGVIWVMQDENKNSLPDDTWYQIAGSSHFYSQTVENYEVTYFRTDTRDVFWKDNQGATGWLMANSFNVQDYYPSGTWFPGYPQDSVVFGGTLLTPVVDEADSQEVTVVPQPFGYADNRPRTPGAEYHVPDNPYTEAVEGAGGDPVDISWAVDHSGHYVDLDSIHFIKIVSGSLSGAGWLGEISTDVLWVEVVQPNPGISGKERLLVVYPYSTRVLAGDSVRLEACLFNRGRKEDVEVSFASSDEQVAVVRSGGWIQTNHAGEAEIFIAAGEEADTIPVKVVVPDSIRCFADFSSLYPGDSTDLACQVFDEEGYSLDVPVQVTSSNPTVGSIVSGDGSLFFEALSSGETVLTFSVEGFSLEEQLAVKVHSPDEVIRIYFTLHSEEENLLPFQWIDVGMADLNHVVQNRQSDYSGWARPVLFHALAAGLQKAGVSFQFRDDEAAGGKLYLYSLEKDGLFTYGWGGKSDPAAFARAWIARLNGQSFLNGFDEIEISNGDTVALYHVADVTSPWNYTRLLAQTDSFVVGEEVEVLLEQTVCTLSGNEISETGFVPVAGAEILAGENFVTGADGTVRFVARTDPPMVVSYGVHAVLIPGKTITGISAVRKKKSAVYPNPFDQELTVAGFLYTPYGKDLGDHGMEEVVIRINTPDGRLVFEQVVTTDPFTIRMGAVPRGMYQLVIIHSGKREIHKILKL